MRSTVFQVYAPDELKQDELISKINEDLAGAVLHWSDSLQCWVFVYNVRRGVPPDVARLLVAKKTEYPTIEMDHWSNDALWEKVRAMSLQKRVEILGAPSGYEHLFFSTHTTEEEIQRHLPDVMWLRSPVQLQELARQLRRILTAIRTKIPHCTGIHVLYAGPTGGAIVLGQVINPRMNPPVHLYQYSRQTVPRYQRALTLTESLGI